MRKTAIIYLLAVLLGFIFSCKKDDVGPNLIAHTGNDTTASIGDTIWLDASATFGSDYEIEWSFSVSPSDDSIAFSMSDSAYFIPTMNGSYTLRLRVTRGTQFSEDFMSVTVEGTFTLSGHITADSTIVVKNPGETDYIVTSNLYISARVVIESGVNIEFLDNTGIIVEETGQLVANSVDFTAAFNDWKGIHLKSQGNVIANCVLDHGGYSSYTGEVSESACLTLTGTARATVSGNLFKNSNGYGVVVKDQAVFEFDEPSYTNAFWNNNFASNGIGSIKAPVNILASMSSPDFSEESENAHIMLYESSYGSTETVAPILTNYGIPYHISGTVTFNKTLTILPGTEVYLTYQGGIIVNGDLNINGSSASPVIIDGLAGTAGSWTGIYVKNGNTLITYTDIMNGGYKVLQGLEEAANLTIEGNLNMQNSKVSGSIGMGIHLKDDAVIQYTSNFSGNTLEDNAVSAIRLGIDDVHKVVSDNSISVPTSTTPAIEVRNGQNDLTGTWTNLSADIDYLIVESIILKGTRSITIESGAVLQFASGTAFQVNGALTASSVVFEGSENTAGHWDGIYIATDNAVSLSNVTITDGGGGTVDQANVIIQPAAKSITITNSSITNSAGYGVLIKLGASDFGINEGGSGNTLGGSLGDFLNENN
ncbi:MAG: hypothetical protein ISS19_10405 [Bacteroidales bacterium]|nr:hypothetical protein [Bacteroidales bacterium]